MKLLHRTILHLLHSHLFVIAVSIVLGLYAGYAFPNFVQQYPNISLMALAGIFFLSALKIKFSKVLSALKDKSLLVSVVIFMLIVLPVVVYYLTEAFYPTLAVSFLLLAAMPSGMTAPFLSELAGGKQGLALVLTVVTSLLAPVTVPTVVYLTAGQHVEVDFVGMFRLLAIVIFIPFVVAQFIKKVAQPTVDKASVGFKTISTFLLGILIMFVVAKRPDEVLQIFQGGDSVIYLLGLIILFTTLHILGYFVIFWRHKRDKVTIAVCLTYMNFTLAIVLADTFFATETNIVVPTVLSVLPWALMFVPFRLFIRKSGLLRP